MTSAADVLAAMEAAGPKGKRAAAALRLEGRSGAEILADRRRNRWIADLWRPYEAHGIRAALVFAASRLAEQEAQLEAARAGERAAMERLHAAEERLRITTEELDP